MVAVVIGMIPHVNLLTRFGMQAARNNPCVVLKLLPCSEDVCVAVVGNRLDQYILHDRTEFKDKLFVF